MRAIIPVAGFGTRLKPHTHTLPKVLLNVGDKPILGHILQKLIEEKIYKATFITGYLGEKIVEYVNKEFPEIKADFLEQSEMLGLGHAVYTAIPTFDEEELFIILGDTVFDVDLKTVFQLGHSALGVKTVDDPSRFGVAVMDNGFIKQLIEKPSKPVSKLALVGLYYIKNPDLLRICLNELIKKDIKTRGEFQLTDALQLMIDKGEKITTFPVEGWYDCGKPETLLSTNRFLLSQNNFKFDSDNVVVIPPVYISKNAIVKNSIIGPYATISDNARVEESVIKNSIVNPGAVVEKSMLEESIIGNNSIIKGNYKKLNAGDSSEIEFH